MTGEEVRAVTAEAERWYDNGCLCASWGRYWKAVECFDRALEINPRYAQREVKKESV